MACWHVASSMVTMLMIHRTVMAYRIDIYASSGSLYMKPRIISDWSSAEHWSQSVQHACICGLWDSKHITEHMIQQLDL